jgi:hypothetical protein
LFIAVLGPERPISRLNLLQIIETSPGSRVVKTAFARERSVSKRGGRAFDFILR